MSVIQHAERRTYDEMWGVEAYAAHSPGEAYAEVFADIVGQRHGTVLDAGCGTGKGALALHRLGFTCALCDLSDEGLLLEAKGFPFVRVCLWDDVKRITGGTDFVYCCDVLEHLPTAFTMLVAARLLEVARQGAFFSVALVPDQFGAWVGKPLHQTVQPYTWWRDALQEVGEVLDARDLLQTGLFFVKGRP